MGTPESPGTVVCTVVGDVERAGVAEFELGTPLRDVITTIGGGPHAGRRIKAVFSGVANAVVTADQLDVPVSYEGFASIGSGMGAAGFYVLDDTACMVETAVQFSRFLAVESCGQCPPCKLGSAEITERLERIQSGVADERDIGEIAAWLAKVTDGARCFLASEEQIVVASIMRAFPEEIEAHIEFHRCPRPRTVPLPKIVDLRDGHAVYDERQARKRPDWTYAPG
jgi:NADH-quinone oxidoreductase subunit F